MVLSCTTRLLELLALLFAPRPLLVAGCRSAEGAGQDQPRHDTQNNQDDQRHYRQAQRVASFTGKSCWVIERWARATLVSRPPNSVRAKSFLLTLTRRLMPSSQISGSGSSATFFTYE